MLFRIYGLLACVVLASFYSVFRVILGTEDVAMMEEERVSTEVRIKSQSYLEKQADRFLAPGRKQIPVRTQEQIHHPSVTDNDKEETSISHDEDGIELVAVPDKPKLNENETTFDPTNFQPPFTQEEMDGYIKRLEVIQNTPDDYYRSKLLKEFKREMTKSLEGNPENESAFWLLEEINHQLADEASTPSPTKKNDRTE